MAGTLSDGFLWQGAVTTGELIILPHSCLTSLHSSDYTEGRGGGGRLVEVEEEEEVEEREAGRTEEGDNCSHWWRSR